MRELDF